MVTLTGNSNNDVLSVAMSNATVDFGQSTGMLGATSLTMTNFDIVQVASSVLSSSTIIGSTIETLQLTGGTYTDAMFVNVTNMLDLAFTGSTAFNLTAGTDFGHGFHTIDLTQTTASGTIDLSGDSAAVTVEAGTHSFTLHGDTATLNTTLDLSHAGGSETVYLASSSGSVVLTGGVTDSFTDVKAWPIRRAVASWLSPAASQAPWILE